MPNPLTPALAEALVVEGAPALKKALLAQKTVPLTPAMVDTIVGAVSDPTLWEPIVDAIVTAAPGVIAQVVRAHALAPMNQSRS